MTRPPGPHASDHLTPGQYEPRHYELRVQGHLDEHWATWFGGLTLTHEKDGTTTLRGPVADQAELYGLLAKVRDLGATLISVTPTRRPTGSEPGSGAGRVRAGEGRRPRRPPAG